MDTNVVLDLLGEREPFYDSAARIASLGDKGKVKLITSAITYSTVFYLLSKYDSKDIVKEKLRKFKVFVATADLTDTIIEKALSSTSSDFEDALQYYCAEEKGVQHSDHEE